VAERRCSGGVAQLELSDVASLFFFFLGASCAASAEGFFPGYIFFNGLAPRVFDSKISVQISECSRTRVLTDKNGPRRPRIIPLCLRLQPDRCRAMHRTLFSTSNVAESHRLSTFAIHGRDVLFQCQAESLSVGSQAPNQWLVRDCGSKT
jgi:hypothetical protein